MIKTRPVIVLEPHQSSVKKTLKKEAQNPTSILNGYSRFLMPLGIVKLPLKEALQKVASHQPVSDKRVGTSFVLLLDDDRYLFYVDYETSLPQKQIKHYQVTLECEGLPHTFDVSTYCDDAVEYAFKELYHLRGDCARSAIVLDVREVS